MTAERVVSLVPSVTETLLAWGVVPVGVTRFCEHPELPAVGGTKDPEVEAIVALAPDLVVMNDEENRREDADALRAAGVRVENLHIDGVDDVAPALAALASWVGVAPPRLAESPAVPPPVPTDAGARAFVPIWRRPWMSLGSIGYGTSLLRRLGVSHVFDDVPAEPRYPTVTLEEVVARSPTVVLAPSEPYPFGPRHLEELATVAPVVFVDGKDLFWWGVRTPAALERLAAQLDALP